MAGVIRVGYILYRNAHLLKGRDILLGNVEQVIDMRATGARVHAGQRDHCSEFGGWEDCHAFDTSNLRENTVLEVIVEWCHKTIVAL